ncbi:MULTISPECIES: helix-turn-helix domain-containing protein [Haloferax]|uniref:DNA-binding protein n=1 Tax=Haloferax marinum TaxID=2666143 RepID=A0A6A8G6Q5_9EURY|nr:MULTISPECIES: helix-turn-helix domain-containing protein [Haloferax]KAB1197270.1 DNA-binding protein [Haloferax sp. CBA1150]MRW96308.1 DNA-binding protein [Haloferax marinum]
MPSGIRATVEFDSPVCQIASIAQATDSIVSSVSTSVATPPESVSVTEFVVDAEDPSEDVDVEPIFSYGTKHVYRISHDGSVDCPCECLGEFGCPIDRYFTNRGNVTLVFHAAGYEQLQDVIGELRNRFPSVDIKRLVRSPTGESSEDNIFVDRARLTARQLEVVQTAYKMGYFERPRRANATEVAAELDISQSTFSEHLAAAQTKLLGDILEEG